MVELWKKRLAAATEVVAELESIYQPDGSGVPYAQLVEARRHKSNAIVALQNLERDIAAAQAFDDEQAAKEAVWARLLAKLQ